MSDFANGWIVWLTSRAAILEALSAERACAFVSRTARPAFVFPRDDRSRCTPDELLVLRVSARLQSAMIVTFSAGDDWGEVSLVLEGRVTHRVATGGRIATRGQLTDATELLRAAGRRPRKKPAPPRIGSDVPRRIVEALGVAYSRVEYRNFERLTADRFEVDPRHPPPDLTMVNETGAEEPYVLALLPVSPPRDAKTLTLDLDASSDLLLDAMRTLDPVRATDEARASLEEVARTGARREATGERRTVVREAAASLLARCLDALPEDEKRLEASRLSRSLLREPDATTRAILAFTLRRVGYLIRPALEKALAKELDPLGARRLYEALHGITHDLSDAELVQRTRSPHVFERKGAYALFEQSPSVRTLRALEKCLGTEGDPSAMALLSAVIQRVAAELDED